MTVKQAIEKLQQLPPNAILMAPDMRFGETDIQVMDFYIVNQFIVSTELETLNETSLRVLSSHKV